MITKTTKLFFQPLRPNYFRLVIFVFLMGLFFPNFILAATLAVSPATGVYQTNSTFSVTVKVNTSGSAINAADGTLTFNPRELSVVSVSRTGSIFNLWPVEPSFSNSAGTVSFSGGIPSGYTGANGSVLSVTFRSLTSGTAKVAITNGSVLAADGRGTNVLTAMAGGTYTLSAVTTAPAPEVIVEYVAPANTPKIPIITSKTFIDQNNWQATTSTDLAWSIPSDVIAVRTLLDSSPISIPTKVYDTPIKSINLNNLEQGVSYFHLQFKNQDGWGKIAHYRLAVDTEKPKSFTIALPDQADLSNPNQTLLLLINKEEEVSAVNNFKVQLDGAEPYEFKDDDLTGKLTLPALEPGYHTVIIEAFDEAGNSLINTFSFTILAFTKPIITDYPQQLNAGVIPVIKGQTRPNSKVEITLTNGMTEPQHYTVNSDDKGEFVFIPDGPLTMGVYTISALAIDQYGARSLPSDTVRIAVEQAGYIALGSFLINILSVFIPLLALLFVTIFGFWYGLIRIKKLRKKVLVESNEALDILKKEFTVIHKVLNAQQEELVKSRKTKKLTKSEFDLITKVNESLVMAENKVTKEMADVEKLVTKK